MKIAKKTHSCLLIEDAGVRILIDPGNYSAQEGALDNLPAIDFLLITHEHQDHMDLESIRKIAQSSPGMTIISNAEVVALLAREGIKATDKENALVKIEKASHEKVLGKTPENILFTVGGKLTHPGDSLQFEKSAPVLALPIQAPWGSLVAAVEKAAKVRPKIVVPIHDWHWHSEARKRLYEMAAGYLQEKGIKLESMEQDIIV